LAAAADWYGCTYEPEEEEEEEGRGVLLGPDEAAKGGNADELVSATGAASLAAPHPSELAKGAAAAVGT